MEGPKDTPVVMVNLLKFKRRAASRKTFVEIATSDHVATIGEDRKMGLEGQWLIAATEASGL